MVMAGGFARSKFISRVRALDPKVAEMFSSCNLEKTRGEYHKDCLVYAENTPRSTAEFITIYGKDPRKVFSQGLSFLRALAPRERGDVDSDNEAEENPAYYKFLWDRLNSQFDGNHFTSFLTVLQNLAAAIERKDAAATDKLLIEYMNHVEAAYSAKQLGYAYRVVLNHAHITAQTSGTDTYLYDETLLRIQEVVSEFELAGTLAKQQAYVRNSGRGWN